MTRLDDNRLVRTEFLELDDYVKVVETFVAEEENSIELQKQGWMAILTNFKKYTEFRNNNLR